MNPDEISSLLGHLGPFQICLFLVVSTMTMVPSSWHMLAIVFIGQEPNYHCAIPAGYLINESIPFNPNIHGSNSKCKVFENYTWTSNKTTYCPNDAYWFGNETNSIVNEFNLTCDRSYLVDLSQMILVIGVSIGAFVCTYLSDRFGRKKILFLSITMVSILGIIVSQLPNYWSFTFIRFFIGVFQQGIILSGFVYTCEIFIASKRTLPGLFTEIIWAFGMCILAGFAYLIRDWRNLMLTISVPLFACLPLYFIIPESLPWLIAKGRFKEARKYLKSGAKFNKIPRKNIDEYLNFYLNEDNFRKDYLLSNDGKEEENHSANYTLLDLFKSKKLRIYCLIMSFLFFTNTLVYYGLSLSTGSLVGNPYLNFFFSGLVEIPAYISAAFALQYFGRRWSMCVFHIISGIALLLTAFLPKNINDYDMSTVITCFSMIGKFAITGSFGSIFLWAPEILPTTIRIQGMGLALVAGRFGNIIAPFSASLSKRIFWLPGLIFGIMSLVSAILSFLLPETLNRPLPQTIEEVEKWNKRVNLIEKKKGLKK